jgi:hypothetical protein
MLLIFSLPGGTRECFFVVVVCSEKQVEKHWATHCHITENVSFLITDYVRICFHELTFLKFWPMINKMYDLYFLDTLQTEETTILNIF